MMSEIDIRIARISEVAGKTHLHRWEMLRYGNNPEDIIIDMKARVEGDSASESLTLRLEVMYSYMRSMVRRPLLDYAVDVVFEIPSIADYVGFSSVRDRVDIPPSLMAMMLNVAIGALRGMIAQKTAGTPIEDSPLPLVNVSQLVSRLIYGDRPSSRTIPVDSQICV